MLWPKGDTRHGAPEKKYVPAWQSSVQLPFLMLDPTRFPAPAVDNPTPPASEGNSPSPPSYTEKDQMSSAPYRYHEEEGMKHKADDITDSEEDSDHPNPKSQHLSEGNKKSGSHKKGTSTVRRSPITSPKRKQQKSRSRFTKDEGRVQK